MKNIYLRIALITSLTAALVSCSGNSSLDSTEAPVFITLEIELYNPDIAICGLTFDIPIETMTLTSHPKDPNGTSSANQDVNINRWVITPVRTDGGTVASPVWTHDMAVYIPSNGTADLSNYRVYPWENLNDLPLSNLFPENGGVDPETGNTNIRQSLWIQVFGKTVSGHDVASESVPVAFNFTCQ